MYQKAWFLLALISLSGCVPSSHASKLSASELPVGRFEIKQISDNRNDQYLVDTVTGRLWLNVCVKNDGSKCTATVWREEFVEGITKVQKP